MDQDAPWDVNGTISLMQRESLVQVNLLESKGITGLIAAWESVYTPTLLCLIINFEDKFVNLKNLNILVFAVTHIHYSIAIHC